MDISSLSAEVVASIASTITSAALASVALAFTHRQNVGWEPLLLVSRSGLKGGPDLGERKFQFTLDLEFWNRRRYPVSVRHLAIEVAGFEMPHESTMERFTRKDRLGQEIKKTVPPGEHLGIEVELPFEYTGLDFMRPMTCSPDCYQSEVESGSFMMVV